MENETFRFSGTISRVENGYLIRDFSDTRLGEMSDKVRVAKTMGEARQQLREMLNEQLRQKAAARPGNPGRETF